MTVYAAPELLEVLRTIGTDLRAVCIVSQLHLAALDEAPAEAAVTELPDGSRVVVTVEKAKGEKCERCWIYSEELGSDPEHPALCPRCAEVIRSLGGAAE